MKILPVVGMVITSFLFLTSQVWAIESDIDQLLNLLVEKGVITAPDAVGFRADLAIKKQEEKAQQKEFTVISGKPIKISGYTQIRYRQDEALNDAFDARRVRLDVRGDITESFDYRLQPDFAGTSAKILDATIGYKFNPWVQLTVGQFKIPFSQENLISSSKLETINRSQVVEALVARGTDVIGNQNGRDIGFQWRGSLGGSDKLRSFDYAVGIFNGAGINTTDTNERKDVVGRGVYHPWPNWAFGGSFYAGKYTLSSVPNQQDDRERFGVEFAYSGNRGSFKGEYIAGKDGLIHKEGGYLQSGYFFIPGKLQGVLKFDTFDSNSKIQKNETDVYTLGGNWYFNKWAFWQINYELKDELGSERDNNAITSQLTLQF